MPEKPNKWLIIGSFLSIYIIWGSTYLANAFGVEAVPPFFWSGTRFLIAAIIIFAILKILRRPIKVSREQLKNSAFAGMMFLTLGNGLMCWALQYIDSGFMSLLVSAQPLILLIMIWVLNNKAPQRMSIIGTILGMIGMYLLVNQSALINSRQQVIGILVCFLCLLFWGYASLFVARADLPKNHFLNAGIQMGVGGLFLMIISFIFEDISLSVFTEGTTLSYFCMFYLVVFGSIIAFTSFNYLLQHVSPEKVATNTYINPIVALFLGWHFRDELITTQSIIATVILFTGVYFINTEKYKKS